MPSLFLSNKEKRLLQIAFSTMIIQSLPITLTTQNKALLPPRSSIPKQLLVPHSATINAGEVVMDLVVEDQVVIPTKSFILFQNQPNPFTKETTIRFELLHSTSLSLTIYNPEGVVLKEYEGYFEKGPNQIQVNGKDLNQYGILYYQMTTKNQILSKKMLFKQPDEPSMSTSTSNPSSTSSF